MKYKRIDIGEVSEILVYEPDTGVLRYKVNVGKRHKAGAIAGSIRATSYGSRRMITIRGKQYAAHRIAWALHYGEDPGDMTIDHINHNPIDNRIANLRLATKQQQSSHRRCKGVRRRKRGKPWMAAVEHMGKQMQSFHECPLLARVAYEDMKRSIFGEYSGV